MGDNLKLSYHEDTGYSKYYYYKLVFGLGLLLAAMIFFPFVFKDNGLFIYYGDYNVQQIPFHRHGVEMMRNGNFGWDWYTDLGSNFSGDYSFYMTTSPFFWIMCLFPSAWAPYMMAPMYTLKFAVAALCAYLYLKRFVRKPLLAVAGALMYAFSGFQIYNIFFNHFHDSVAFFPLMLLGIEELVQNNRRGFFAFAVFICGSVNYFFFIGQVVFCVLYFFFRAASLSFKITLKKFFLLMFEAVTGALMSLVFLLPSLISIMGNNRLDRAFGSVRDAFLWRTKGELYTKRYGHIFQSLFFPPDIPSRPEFFGGKDLSDTLQTHTTRWASNAAWVPLFGMTGAITYMWNRRKSWLTRFMLFLMLFALIPVLNSLFYVGNTSYYARWMYMFVMMLVLATVISLDRSNIRWGVGISLTAVISVMILAPSFISWKNIDGLWQTTRSSYPERIAISTAISALCIGLTFVLVKYLRGRKIFEKILLYVLSGVIVIYGAVHVFTGKQHCSDSSVKYYVENCLNTSVTMKDKNSDPDWDKIEGAPIDNLYEQFYRMDLYNKDGSSRSHLDNYGLFWGIPSMQCFNSAVPASILNFYPKVGVERNVASRAANTYFGLRGFLSVKYCFVEQDDISKYSMKGFTEKPVSKQNVKDDGAYRFNIYENEYYLPMGFTYSGFITEKEFEKIDESKRHIYLCSCLVVPDAEADYYRTLLPELTSADLPAANFDTYANSVVDRRNGAVCEGFTWDSYGFKATIDTSSANMVFFSVPYDLGEVAGFSTGGWSAKVNGKAVDIHKVFYGFMAVEVPAGQDVVIEFEYDTPGRTIGLLASLVGFLLFAGYLLYFKKVKKEQPEYNFISGTYYDDLGYPDFAEDESSLDNVINLFKKKDKQAENILPQETEDADNQNE